MIKFFNLLFKNQPKNVGILHMNNMFNIVFYNLSNCVWESWIYIYSYIYTPQQKKKPTTDNFKIKQTIAIFN